MLQLNYSSMTNESIVQPYACLDHVFALSELGPYVIDAARGYNSPQAAGTCK
jgi:hypothetical protein